MLHLKTGVENVIFWSETGSGFGETGGTHPPRIPRSTPSLPPGGGGEGHLLTRVLIFETQRHRLSMQTAWQRMTNPHS